jgi:hypothetical protein
MTQEALKLALEALITITDAIYVNSQQEADAVYKANDAVKAIKEALAQPEQEPVATLFGSLPVYDTTTPRRTEQAPTWWLVEYHDWAREFVTERPEESIAVEKITALYTHPPQRTWVALTEQERNDIEDYCEMMIGKPAFDAIEAKLKEKNT